MLAYKNRFHGHSSLRFVYKNGRVSRSRIATVKAVRNKYRRDPRVAVVISKKVIKSAVGRNRIRRRIYEIIRRKLPEFVSVYDVVCIMASSDARTMPHEELEEVIVKSLQELKVLY